MFVDATNKQKLTSNFFFIEISKVVALFYDWTEGLADFPVSSEWNSDSTY